MSSDYTILALNPVDPLDLYDAANTAVGGTRDNKEPDTDFYGASAHRNKTGQELDALLTVYYSNDGGLLHEDAELEWPAHYASVRLSISGSDRDAAARITGAITEWLTERGVETAFYDHQEGTLTSR